MMNQSQNLSDDLSVSAEDDYDKYSVRWKKEVVYILRAIMEKGGLVSAYFDRGQDFILTSIIDIDPDHGVLLLDLGVNEALNRKILDSDKIIFVSAHDRVKVQFSANRVEKARFEDREALRVALPESLIKFQRREYYRVPTPIVNSLKCLIPMGQGHNFEVTIADISIGGIGVVLPSMDIGFEPGTTFHGCLLALPNFGNLLATLEVRGVFEVILRNGLKAKRAGCQLVDLSANMQSMIQRYIIKVERERRAMELGRQ